MIGKDAVHLINIMWNHGEVRFVLIYLLKDKTLPFREGVNHSPVIICLVYPYSCALNKSLGKSENMDQGRKNPDGPARFCAVYFYLHLSMHTHKRGKKKER